MKDIILKDIFSYNTLNTRRVVILITLFFSIATYCYLVDFYATDFSIFSYIPFRKLPSYDFYTGSEQLTYYQVGSHLQQAFPQVHNKETKGGIDNAAMVLTSSKPSFGLVQEDVLKADDFMKTRLNFAAPIYLERMHVIYDRNVFKNWDSGIPQISSHTRPDLLNFFAHAKINIGPVGSGTKKIASYIMEAIYEQIRARQAEETNENLVASVGQIRGDLERNYSSTHRSANLKREQGSDGLTGGELVNHGDIQDDTKKENMPQILLTDSWDALDCLKSRYNSDNRSHASNNCIGRIPDIVFIVTGSPCQSIKKLVIDESDKFGLISIDLTFINNLNLKYGTNFRATDYKDKYDKIYNGTTTLGTYAYLVTDQRTPSIDILTILRQLNSLKLRRVEDNSQLAPVLKNDFDFLEYYEKQSHGQLMLSLRNLLVFLVTLGMTFTPSFIFLSWFVSGIQQMKYLSKLSKVIEESIPINEEHEQEGQAQVMHGGGDQNNNNSSSLNDEKKSVSNALINIGDKRKRSFAGRLGSGLQTVKKFVRSGKRDDSSAADREDAHECKYLRPKINPSQSEIINKIIMGLINLNNLRREISMDTGVNDTHTSFLIGRIDQIVDKLRKSLGIRLNGVIKNHDPEVNERLLLKYLTADWITKDDYEWLGTKLREGKLS